MNENSGNRMKEDGIRYHSGHLQRRMIDNMKACAGNLNWIFGNIGS